ncbi:MAG: hypothetical protein M1832_000200, partial [Thelocarpon impressellum]
MAPPGDPPGGRSRLDQMLLENLSAFTLSKPNPKPRPVIKPLKADVQVATRGVSSTAHHQEAEVVGTGRPSSSATEQDIALAVTITSGPLHRRMPSDPAGKSSLETVSKVRPGRASSIPGVVDENKKEDRPSRYYRPPPVRAVLAAEGSLDASNAIEAPHRPVRLEKRWRAPINPELSGLFGTVSEDEVVQKAGGQSAIIFGDSRVAYAPKPVTEISTLESKWAVANESRATTSDSLRTIADKGKTANGHPSTILGDPRVAYAKERGAADASLESKGAATNESKTSDRVSIRAPAAEVDELGGEAAALPRTSPASSVQAKGYSSLTLGRTKALLDEIKARHPIVFGPAFRGGQPADVQPSKSIKLPHVTHGERPSFASPLLDSKSAATPKPGTIDKAVRERLAQIGRSPIFGDSRVAYAKKTKLADPVLQSRWAPADESRVPDVVTISTAAGGGQTNRQAGTVSEPPRAPMQKASSAFLKVLGNGVISNTVKPPYPPASNVKQDLAASPEPDVIFGDARVAYAPKLGTSASTLLESRWAPISLVKRENAKPKTDVPFHAEAWTALARSGNVLVQVAPVPAIITPPRVPPKEKLQKAYDRYYAIQRELEAKGWRTGQDFVLANSAMLRAMGKADLVLLDKTFTDFIQGKFRESSASKQAEASTVSGISGLATEISPLSLSPRTRTGMEPPRGKQEVQSQSTRQGMEPQPAEEDMSPLRMKPRTELQQTKSQSQQMMYSQAASLLGPENSMMDQTMGISGIAVECFAPLEPQIPQDGVGGSTTKIEPSDTLVKSDTAIKFSTHDAPSATDAAAQAQPRSLAEVGCKEIINAAPLDAQAAPGKAPEVSTEATPPSEAPPPGQVLWKKAPKTSEAYISLPNAGPKAGPLWAGASVRNEGPVTQAPAISSGAPNNAEAIDVSLPKTQVSLANVKEGENAFADGRQFLKWPKPPPRSTPSAQVRKVLLANLPPGSTISSVYSLVFFGIIEEVVYKPGSTGAQVYFVSPADCMKYYAATANGIVVEGIQTNGRPHVVWVELAVEPAPLGSYLKTLLEKGATRCVRAVGVLESLGKEHLEKIARKQSRELERLEIGRTSAGARYAIFSFAKIQNAIAFKNMLTRDDDFETCNVQYADDP